MNGITFGFSGPLAIIACVLVSRKQVSKRPVLTIFYFFVVKPTAAGYFLVCMKLSSPEHNLSLKPFQVS